MPVSPRERDLTTLLRTRGHPHLESEPGTRSSKITKELCVGLPASGQRQTDHRMPCSLQLIARARNGGLAREVTQTSGAAGT